MAYRTVLDRQPERASGIITFTLTDAAGAAVAKAAMDGLRLTVYDRETGTIINSRNNQDVLDLNGGTMHATSGLVTFVVDPADMASSSATGPTFQDRVFLFVATWGDDGERAHEVVIPVENLQHYPAA